MVVKLACKIIKVSCCPYPLNYPLKKILIYCKRTLTLSSTWVTNIENHYNRFQIFFIMRSATSKMHYNIQYTPCLI
ncbi:unnamed protein product [Acanthoscelides obtectus]|uniref:Uncharacterized protein n=1 Tax=Acanthoscelides obtectus TaxID=200917 RepID=A0A9P0JX51_ACAOB|nr:unnamed protein product [Acanthoscelides obtectus]CAK1639156.1 hypothetical protein AOBTE_LOCUS11019 [Acanthoscelides obtectus]